MTQKEVAQHLGISQVTVSYALNKPDSPKCSPKLRKKIRDYCAKHAPELLRSGKSFQIALAIVGRKLERPFYHPLVESVTEAAQKLDYQVLVTEPTNLSKLYKTNKFDGLLTVGPLSDYSFLVQDLPENLPQIMLNEYQPDIAISYYMPDYLAGHYQVIKHLYETGHRKICGMFVTRLGFPTQVLHFKESESSFHYCLREFKLPTKYCRHVEIPAILSADLIPYFSEAIDSLLRNGDIPDVFFCGDGYLPYLIASLKEKGFKPFEDVSIIGYDNVNAKRMEITSLDFNFKEMGALAVHQLYEEICSGKQKNIRVNIRPELIIRNSLRRFK